MNNPRHFMLDIETTALTTRAGVWQFAMVEFDLETGELKEGFINDTLGWGAQEDRDVSQDTVDWTLEHGDHKLFKHWDWGRNSSTSIADLYTRIEDRLGDYETDPYMVWCKGAKFDFAILQDLFHDRLSLPAPWHYRSEMCLRSVAQAYRLKTGVPYLFDKASHNAFDDCRSQAMAARDIMWALRHV